MGGTEDLSQKGVLKQGFQVKSNPDAPAYEPEKWNLDPQEVGQFNQQYSNFFDGVLERNISKLGQREYALMFSDIFESDELQKLFKKTPDEWEQFRSDATRVFKLEQGNGLNRANCYGYAMNNMDPLGTIGSQHPGDSVKGVERVSGDDLDSVPSVIDIREASAEDIDGMVGRLPDYDDVNAGLKHLVDNLEAEGAVWMGSEYPQEIEDGHYRVVAYVSNVYGDYHFVRENDDGTFSHKKGPGEPVTNMGMNGEVLDAPDDLSGPNIGMPVYAKLGYLSVPPSVDVGYRDDRDISDIHDKGEALYLIGVTEFPHDEMPYEGWTKPEERVESALSDPLTLKN